ncbi:hypothetical protein KCV07_g4024, partial [Aureobasidium melanogenum]
MASTTSSSAEKRAATPQGADRAQKRPKLTMAEIKKEPVFMLYRNYLSSKVDAPDTGLDNFVDLCQRFNWIPTLDMVNFVTDEANIIDEEHRLEFPVYPFIQEFKFFMYACPETDHARMLVGKIHHLYGVQEVWAGWSKANDDPETGEPESAAETMLYYTPFVERDGSDKLECEQHERTIITWEEPFESLFRMSDIHDYRDPEECQRSSKIQDAIMLSVAKVVVRFPGLMRPFDDEIDSMEAQFHLSNFSPRPFDDREACSPHSGYWPACAIINSGPDPSVREHRCHPPDSPRFTPDSKAA